MARDRQKQPAQENLALNVNFSNPSANSFVAQARNKKGTPLKVVVTDLLKVK